MVEAGSNRLPVHVIASGYTWRWWLSLLVGVCLGLVAQAAPITVTFTATPAGLEVRSETAIRFFVDYAARMVVLPEAVVAADSNPQVGGEGVKLELRSDGAILRFERPFTLTLSPNGKLLSIILATS